MNKPLISIVIPIYNAESYILACVDSIIRQTYENIEVILVDDGSRDGSGLICDEYSKNHKSIRSIHLENGGVSRARNIGMQYITGEYVCFIDADDTIANDFIENFVQAIEPGISIYIQGCKITDRDGVVRECVYPKIGVQTIQAIFDDNNLCGQGYAWAKLYNTQLLKYSKVEFNPNVKFSEDLLFILGCLMFTDKIKYLPQTGYDYYLREGNASGKIFPVDTEVECIESYRALIGSLSRKYEVDITSISKVGEIFTMLFSRVRNSIYTCVTHSKEDRLKILSRFTNDDFAIVKKYHYISNPVVRFGNLFLSRQLLCGYDLFFKLIYKLKI